MKVIEGLTAEQKEILKTPLEAASLGKGHTIKEVRITDKVCKLIESCEDRLELEDADYDFLRNRFNSFDNWLATGDARAKILEVADKLA